MAESKLETLGSPKKKADVVVVAVDGSEYSDYALQFYVDTLHKPDNHVIIVHSTEYKYMTHPALTGISGDPSFSVVTQTIEEEETKANALVEVLTAKMEKMKVAVEFARIHGEAGPGVVSLVHDKHADYVVVGCRGKGTVRRTFTGSVTDYITHHSHVPVLIARHKDHIKHHHGFHMNPFHHHHKHKHDDDKGHNHNGKAQTHDENTN